MKFFSAEYLEDFNKLKEIRFSFMYPISFIVIRASSIISLVILSNDPTPLQGLFRVNQELSILFNVFSALFWILSIGAHYEMIYKVLKYDKFLSVIISGILSIFTEIIWIITLVDTKILYFEGLQSMKLYFLSYFIFAFTSLVLLIEYKNQTNSEMFLNNAQSKSIFYAKIGLEIMITIFIIYLLGLNCIISAFLEYSLVAIHLIYFYLFSNIINCDDYYEIYEKEKDFLYTTTL